MKKLLLGIIITVLFLPLAISAAEQIEIYGFTYFTPPEQIGTVVTVVGFLEPPVGFTYPFAVDFSSNEYTFYYQATITQITTTPFFIDYEFSDEEFFIYEDPSRNGDYGSNPPNGTSPVSFRDGTLILQGTLSNFLRTDDPFGFLPPATVADCEFTGGAKLGELIQGMNWTMHGGLTINPGNLPAGYQQGWTGKIFFTGPVPTEESTWGMVKSLSR